MSISNSFAIHRPFGSGPLLARGTLDCRKANRWGRPMTAHRHHLTPRHTPVVVAIIVMAFAALWLASPVRADSSLAPSAPETAADLDVIGDDEIDAFVGTGSLILPGRIGSPARQAAASCPGCSWRAVLTCDRTTATACRGAARTCAYDSQWLTIYVTAPGGVEQWLGSACFGPGGPASRASVEQAVTQELSRRVPPLSPAMSPSAGALVYLPVRFTCGQSDAELTWDWTLAGMAVSVASDPRWQWRFEPGVDLVTPQAGSLNAGGGVEHAFVQAGRYEVQVSSVWQGRYWADGLGPLTVQTPLRQVAQISLDVGQARAVLVR